MKQQGILPYVVLAVAVLGFGLAVALVFRGQDGPAGLGEAGRVGLIEVIGPITDGRPMIEAIDKLLVDKKTKAILVRIDSPGGAVGPSQEIYEALLAARAQKPVVVSMGAVAASGGFYIASAASRVVANAGTITGSIGVIMAFADLSKLMDWAKVDINVVKTGEFKDTGAAYRPITDAERAYLSGVAEEVLDQFVGDVARARSAAGLTTDAVRAVADGRIFTGAAAQRMQFVDTVGGFATAVSMAAELGGIEGRPDLYKPRLGPSWFERMMQEGPRGELGRNASALTTAWALWWP